MRAIPLFLAATSSVMLTGCLAKTVVDVATAPVKVVSKGVDLATTSQSEADEKRGREVRKREERLAQLEREYNKQLEACRQNSEKACTQARATYAEMQLLIPAIPVEPDPR